MPNARDPHSNDAVADRWLDFGPGWLFTSMRDAIVVADCETGRIALWNPAATDLFGFAPEEALQLSLGDLVADVQETPQWRAACVGDCHPHPLELFARRKAGTDVCVELTFSRLDSALRSASLPRKIRDFTVPSETPRTSAISS